MENGRNYEDEAEEYGRVETERMWDEQKEALQYAKDKAAESIGFGQWINVSMNPHLINSETMEKLINEACYHFHNKMS